MADEGNDALLATLAHEFRSPLNAILGWSRMLRAGHVPPTETARVLSTIEQNASALSALVEDFLETARIGAGKVALQWRRVDLAEVTRGVVFALRPMAEGRGVHLELTLEESECFIDGDGSRLRQVIENLASNALKFTPRGGHVALSLARRGDQVFLGVSDTGEGIDSDGLPHVFERFWQGRPHAGSGLGLGLSLVRDIVQMHGGSVSADSDGEGCGSTFVVTLPVSAAGGHMQPDDRDLRSSRIRLRPLHDAKAHLVTWDDEEEAMPLSGAAR
jgi:signal transduction histidine kinase